MTYFSDQPVDGQVESGMEDNKNACEEAFEDEIYPFLSEVVGYAADEGINKLSDLIANACEAYVQKYTKKLKMLSKFPFLKKLAKKVAEWVCGQIGEVVAKAVGEKFDQAAGEAIDNTIEDIG